MGAARGGGPEDCVVGPATVFEENGRYARLYADDRTTGEIHRSDCEAGVLSCRSFAARSEASRAGDPFLKLADTAAVAGVF